MLHCLHSRTALSDWSLPTGSPLHTSQKTSRSEHLPIPLSYFSSLSPKQWGAFLIAWFRIDMAPWARLNDMQRFRRRVCGVFVFPLCIFFSLSCPPGAEVAALPPPVYQHPACVQQWDLCQGEGSLRERILKQVLCYKASAPHGENQDPCSPMLGV